MTESIEVKGGIPDYLLPRFDGWVESYEEDASPLHSDRGLSRAEKRSVWGENYASIDYSSPSESSGWGSEIF